MKRSVAHFYFEVESQLDANLVLEMRAAAGVMMPRRVDIASGRTTGNDCDYAAAPQHQLGVDAYEITNSATVEDIVEGYGHSNIDDSNGHDRSSDNGQLSAKC